MDVSTTSAIESLVARVINTWRAGESPDAAKFIAHHPHLRLRPGVMLDLAFEEYCLRKEAGETLSLESFCDRFPTCRRSLGRLLAIHECSREDAELAADLDDPGVAWPRTDSEFLGFQLVRELGRGAFAHVYLAKQPALGHRLVVVKVAQHGSGEAVTLGRLAHRNIVPVYSVDEDPTTHMTAVCMPYLGSATLLDVLDLGYADNRPPERAALIQEIALQEAIPHAVPDMYAGQDACLQRGTFVDGIVHLAIQIAEALQHTHDAGVCHRDLKPSNVLLTPSGCPLLMDFNLSSDIQLERTFVGGTLPYMSPEQLRGMTAADPVQEADADPRSDLFSLGVILFELLTGRLPFGDRVPGATPADAAEQLLARQRAGCPSVRRGNPRVNTGLERIIRQCLNLHPDQRPASAQALARALRRQLTPAARCARWARRRRFLIGAGVLVAGLIGGIVAALVATRTPDDLGHYEAGIRAFHSHQWAAAIDHFTRVHTARPDLHQPLFARGQAHLMAGDYVQAIADFKAADAMSPNGCVTAWIGYGHDCEGVDLKAEYYYASAVNKYGYEHAAIWNNRGYFARGRGALPTAIQYLTRAIELDPTCQTAYHNRALAYSKREDKLTRDGVSCGQLAIQDIERAVQIGPAHSTLMIHAARIHAQYNKAADAQQRVMYYLQRALDLGFDRQEMLNMSELGDAVLRQVAQYPAATLVLPRQNLRMPLPNRFFPLFAP